ncbi:hypothetical protein OHS70_38370 (plasmid) [Streptomyces sp. NBC_00390]|uniref:hypothetical protein n=1 Tax=Streptomyces sp. NBC_00390 TaxID=2975736 RepID=UPI002E20B707
MSLLLVLIFSFGLSSAGASAAVVADPDPRRNADYGPPKPPPKEWEEGGQSAGINEQGNWCILGEADNCNLTVDELLTTSFASLRDASELTAYAEYVPGERSR